MMSLTPGRLVGMISLRERSGSSFGLMPTRASSGIVSSKIRPLDSARLIGSIRVNEKGPKGPDSEEDFTVFPSHAPISPGGIMGSARHREHRKSAVRAGLVYVTDGLAGITRQRSGTGWTYYSP